MKCLCRGARRLFLQWQNLFIVIVCQVLQINLHIYVIFTDLKSLNRNLNVSILHLLRKLYSLRFNKSVTDSLLLANCGLFFFEDSADPFCLFLEIPLHSVEEEI